MSDEIDYKKEFEKIVEIYARLRADYDNPKYNWEYNWFEEFADKAGKIIWPFLSPEQREENDG